MQSYDTWESVKDNYDNPSWPYKQAHANGAKTELKYLTELLNF